MADWKELKEKLKKLQNDFVDAVENLKEHQKLKPGVCGEWSSKEVIAHLSGWDKEILRQFKLFKDGLEKAIEHDIDEFNKKSVAERKNLNWDETLSELKEIHKNLQKEAASITAEVLVLNKEYEEWIEIDIEHYEHHLKQIREWI